MKIFKSEYSNNYNTYTFSFTEYALMENIDDIPKIYDQGFLPYTGNIKISYPIFYLSRSLRVNLSQFSDTSENKRVNKKFEDLSPEIQRIPLTSFDINDKNFIDFCLTYAKKKFSNNAMNEKRFLYILKNGLATDIFEFKDSSNGALLGFVLAVLNSNTFHYWFSFFNTDYKTNIPLGKWMMWKMIKWSKDKSMDYIYLGTAYGTKSLYKIRDFKGIEFFDGNIWNNDIKQLKSLCKSDSINKDQDFFKTINNPNKYLEQILFR